MAETYVLVMRCPVYKQRDSHSGFRTELENLGGDGDGKGTNGKTVRLKVRMRQPGADYSVVAKKQGNSCGAKGVGHPHQDPQGQRATGRTRGFWWEAAAFPGWHEPDKSRGLRPVL